MLHILVSGLLLASALFTSTVFVRGEGGYDTFRIPAITRTNDGTLLAFAEGRVDGMNDTGNIDLVLKRSTDNGRSWGPLTVVWDDGSNTCGNPSPVVDRKSGKIILVTTWNDGRDPESKIHARQSIDTRRVFVQFSEDDGLSWTKPHEITSQAKLPEWTWYATGPCHALQISKGAHKGRIVVPCNHGVYDDVYGDNGPANTVGFVIYSDDLGQSWKMGESLKVGNEATVAERHDGSLMINMRGYGGRHYHLNGFRWTAVSTDGGESFGFPCLNSDLSEPCCEGSMINYAPKGRVGKKLLFSNPGARDGRKDIRICMSRDDGLHWAPVYTVEGENAAYSDMVVLPDGSVGMVHETGVKSAYEEIRFTLVPAENFR